MRNCTEDCPSSFHVHGEVTLPDNAIEMKDDEGRVTGWVVGYPPVDEPTASLRKEEWTDVGYTVEGEALIKTEPTSCVYCDRRQMTAT